MKLKFNRNVRHSGQQFLQGHVYDVRDEATAQHLLSLTHTDVFVRQREGDFEDKVEVRLAEVASETAQAEAPAAPAPKQAAPQPATPPAPKAEGTE